MAHDVNDRGQLTARKTTEDVRRELARTREEVSLSVERLRREVATTTDWRHWVGERPLAFCAAAFTLGFLLGRR